MVELNRELFRGLGAALAAGGFSRKVAGPGAGSSPSGNKYMVGGYKGVGSDHPITPPMSDSDIHTVASAPEMAPVLHEPKVFLGGWLGSAPERQSFDASEAYSIRNPDTRYAGRLAAAERNQEAVAVIKGGEYSGDLSYPYYVPGESQSGRHPDLFDAAWASSRGGSLVDPVWQKVKSGE